jgi:hypothetical protein
LAALCRDAALGLGEEVEFFGVGPDFAFGGGIGERELAGVSFFPPALGFGVGGHLLHVGVEVFAGVFEVGEEVELAVNLALVDGEVADVALFDHVVDGGPGIGVELAVVFGFLGFEAGDPGVTMRGWGGAAGEDKSEEEELGFHGIGIKSEIKIKSRIKSKIKSKIRRGKGG